MSDVGIAWLDLIEAEHSRLWRVIQAAMTNSDKAYLVYMAARLLEMRRLFEANRFNLPSLRSDHEPLSQAGHGRDLWQSHVSQ
ncbi:MAG: hypothetical protein OXE94_13780 [Aestuariivita sp.]|nr:hypothetical protein [Aestuariivita sp.]MCY4203010.1 hypothetical protein [Aestuariivita sp.]